MSAEGTESTESRVKSQEEDDILGRNMGFCSVLGLYHFLYSHALKPLAPKDKDRMLVEQQDSKDDAEAEMLMEESVIRTLNTSQNVNILILVEPCVSGARAESLLRKFGFDTWIRVEATRYAGAKVPHLCKFGLDHRPLLVNYDPSINIRRGKPPFRCQATWLLEEGFIDVVNNSWNQTKWDEKIKCFTKTAKEWNRNTIEYIPAKKKAFFD
ncbi:hypothetical protein K1719_034045 [Acacia pycnantha]|nr:hypothetical protein K1719_034045 [Acacia pycnantha]